ncbi:hypothetical protein ACX1DX_13315 [Tessaracoccus sp. Y36]
MSARHLIDTLADHELVGDLQGYARLGPNGYMSPVPWQFDGETDYIPLSMICDMLRMFSPLQRGTRPAVNSYSLKNVAEQLLGEVCPYVSNGQVIWAAAALGLPMAAFDEDGPNLLVGIPKLEFEYVRRIVSQIEPKPRTHHYRPPGFVEFQNRLALAAEGHYFGVVWRPSLRGESDAPFHRWLVKQADRDDRVGDLARDYSVAVRESSHGIAPTPEALLAILRDAGASDSAHDAAAEMIAEWMDGHS